MARHQSASVRVAAIRVLEGLCERNAEEYLAYVPEMIPTVTELLDGASCALAPPLSCFSPVCCEDTRLPSYLSRPDDAPEVERQCKRLVSAMEAITGEPLQKYF
jgi:hypothetical protein